MFGTNNQKSYTHTLHTYINNTYIYIIIYIWIGTLSSVEYIVLYGYSTYENWQKLKMLSNIVKNNVSFKAQKYSFLTSK